IAPVGLLTAISQADPVERARGAGAMADAVRRFTPEQLLPAIESAVSPFRATYALGDEAADVSERLARRKGADRAKGLLQTQMNLSEAEAFRWIQKASMDRRLTMREVADAVISQMGSKK